MLLQVRELKVNLKNQLESPGNFLQDLQEKTVFFDGLMLGSKTAKIFIQLRYCSAIDNPVGAGSPIGLNAANNLNKPALTPQKTPTDIVAKSEIQLRYCSAIDNPVGAGSPIGLNAANNLNKPALTPQKTPTDIVARSEIQLTFCTISNIQARHRISGGKYRILRKIFARNRVSENGARYQIQGTYQKYPEVVKVVSAGRGINAVKLRVKEGAGWKGEELIKKDSSTYSTLRMLVARPIALGSASNYFGPSPANNKKSGLAKL